MESKESVSTEPASAELGRLLVVDDEAANCDVLRRAFRGEYAVVTATSVAEALDHLADGRAFDLILCDLLMPDTTGIELYTALLEKDPERARRFVFITGGATSASEQRFIDTVPNPVVDKPFDLRELRELLRERIRVLDRA